MDTIKHDLDVMRQYLTSFLKWVSIALLIGGLVGLLGTFFHFAIEIATHLRITYTWLLYLLPLGGILIVFLYKITGRENDKGTNLILLSIHTGEEQPPLRMAPLIFISTTLTHLLGGSSGREGAALQLGGSIAAFIGKYIHLDDKDTRVIIMCGMSAAFTALFRTPLAAAIFSMEVISVGVMYYAALVPCVLAALVAYGISGAFNIPATSYTLTHIPEVTVLSCIQIIGIAILCGGLCIIFCKSLHSIEKAYKKYLPNAYGRILTGGILVILLTLIIGSKDYLGAGMPIIEKALIGEVVPFAFILKMIFTAITLGAGFKGGEIVPAFFTGATFGCLMGPFIGLPASFSASIGLIALFCGVTNCPITSFILSVELFGSEGILFFMLSIAVSYMLSGYSGLYSKQKIMYSKLKPEYVNELTH